MKGPVATVPLSLALLDGDSPVYESVGGTTIPNAGGILRPPGSIVRQGTSYYLNVGTYAVPVWVIVNGVIPTPRERWAARGRALAGISDNAGGNGPVILFEDFERTFDPPPGFTRVSAGGGTGVASLTRASSVRMQSSAAAGARIQYHGAALPVLSINPFSGKWYCAFRFQLGASTFNATSVIGAGFRSLAGATTVMGGVLGFGSTANFGFQCNGNEAGTFIDSGLAVDLNVHVMELYHTGDGNLRARLDLGNELSASLGGVPPGAYALLDVFSGGAAVNHDVDFDWYLFVGDRPNT